MFKPSNISDDVIQKWYANQIIYKFQSIEKIGFDPPVIDKKIEPTNNDLLIYYICTHNIGYLSFLDFSIRSFLLNSDMSNYNVHIYIDNRFNKDVRVKKIEEMGSKIIWVDGFTKKFNVIHMQDNKMFKKFVCIDVDTYATPPYKKWFKNIQKINAPIALTFSQNTSVERALLQRKPQSDVYRTKTNSEYLACIDSFLKQHDKNLDGFVNTNLWYHGYFTIYDRDILEKIDFWKQAYAFVSTGLQTACDEMLCALLNYCYGGVEDLSKKFNMRLAHECYDHSKRVQSIAHPFLGHACAEESKNRIFMKFVFANRSII